MAKSLLEELIRGMVNINNQSLNYTPIKKALVFFGKRMPISQEILLKETVINDAEKIFDLLLCYGLVVKCEWTTEFSQLMCEIRIKIKGGQDQGRSALRGIVSPDMEVMDAPPIPDSLEPLPTIMSRVIRQGFSLYAHYPSLACEAVLGHLVQLYEIHFLLPQIALTTTTAIQEEKEALFNQYKEQFTYLIQMPNWPNVLTALILQYVTTASNEVFESRHRQQRTLKFWKTKQEIKAEVEKENQRHEEFFKLQVATEALKTDLGEEAHRLVVEYLTESPSCGF